MSAASLRLGKNTDTDRITDWVGPNNRAGHVSTSDSRLVGILTLLRPAQSLVAMLIMITRALIWIVMIQK
jgi:hypothetical protein